MFIAGLAGIIPKGQSVIYVSKQFQLYGVSSKTLTGQLKNRTNSDVCIETLTLYVSTNKQTNDIEYEYLTYHDIIVPASGVYDFYQTGIRNTYSNVSLSNCVIDGKKCSLEYSSDETFIENDYLAISCLIGGGFLIILSILVFVDYLIKKKEVKY